MKLKICDIHIDNLFVIDFKLLLLCVVVVHVVLDKKKRKKEKTCQKAFSCKNNAIQRLL